MKANKQVFVSYEIYGTKHFGTIMGDIVPDSSLPEVVKWIKWSIIDQEKEENGIIVKSNQIKFLCFTLI